MILNSVLAIFLLMALVALFFFSVTRGALLLRAISPGTTGNKSHVYPIYSDMRLIRLVDYQPIISAILLFQYDRLVARIVSDLHQMDLRDKQVLITSCAFGNVIPEVVKAALQSGAKRILIADIVQNELMHARTKLGELSEKVDFIEDDATKLQLDDELVDVNVMFFLLHELPHNLKYRALNEAVRMLRSGGKLYLAEFHRPSIWLLRTLSWTYFKVFEPYGLGLWGSHDPVDHLENHCSLPCQRTTYCFGNFQVISATRPE